MTERTPGELHSYNINKEGSKLVKRFRGLQPSSAEGGESVSRLLRYFVELIDDNPITITSRNAATMFARIGRAESVAYMGDWWFEKPQQLVCVHITDWPPIERRFCCAGSAEDWTAAVETALPMHV